MVKPHEVNAVPEGPTSSRQEVLAIDLLDSYYGVNEPYVPEPSDSEEEASGMDQSTRDTIALLNSVRPEEDDYCKLSDDLFDNICTVDDEPEAGPSRHAPAASSDDSTPADSDAPEAGSSAPTSVDAAPEGSTRRKRRVDQYVDGPSVHLYVLHSDEGRHHEGSSQLPQRHPRAWNLFRHRDPPVLPQGRGTPSRPGPEASGFLRGPYVEEDWFADDEAEDDDEEDHDQEDGQAQDVAPPTTFPPQHPHGLVRKRDDLDDDDEPELPRPARKRRAG